MKKLFIILFAAALFAGCDSDEVSNKIVVPIYVDPDGWEAYYIDGEFDHYYADIHMRELSDRLLDNGFYHTYWQYQDGQALVQEGEGVTLYEVRWDAVQGEWVRYSETIGCSYSYENLRITIRRSDFWSGRPEGRLYFRFVALY